MRIYKNQTVFDAALERIGWIFGEFSAVICCVSGGKDSTVLFYLTLRVAQELHRLPLKVMFLDQEAEWSATIEQIRGIMYHPDVEPFWYQMPIQIFNAVSQEEHWLQCWDPEKEQDWVHPRDKISIKENVYGTKRFHELFPAIMLHDYPDSSACYVAGVRTEESPTRFIALTDAPKYKWVTWGRTLDKRRDHFTFYPLYDWSYLDIWKAIQSHGWPYNRIYDYQYQHGLAIKEMRVSNLHHETAVDSLFHLQEMEPETYARIVKRIAGADMAGKLGRIDYMVNDLPFMFRDWREYRDYLLEHLIDNPQWRGAMRKQFQNHDRQLGEDMGVRKYKAHIKAILVHDWEGITLSNFFNRPNAYTVRKRWRREASNAI